MATKLNELNGMPQMEAAFAGWASVITLKVITQTIVDGFVTDSESNISFQGVIQPLSPNKLYFKPEGQRSFEWLQIHCLNREINLNTNDRIVYNNKRYKVMAKSDYGLNNYIEYHAIEDYE